MPTIDNLTATLELDSNKFNSGIKKATTSLGSLGSSFDSISSGSANRFKQSMGGIGSTLTSFSKIATVTGVAVGASFGWLATTGAKIDSLVRGLNFATGSVDGGAKAFTFLSEESNRLGVNLEVAAKSFKGLAAAAKGGSLEGDKIREIWVSVAEASSVMGLSTQQTELALVALTQMVNKGVISAEEFRQQLAEHIPGATQAMADALGVSTAKLSEMMSTGALISDRVLPKFAAQLRKTVGPDVIAGSESLRASIERLKNTWLLVKGAILDSDAQNILKNGIVWVTNAVGKLPELVGYFTKAWNEAKANIEFVYIKCIDVYNTFKSIYSSIQDVGTAITTSISGSLTSVIEGINKVKNSFMKITSMFRGAETSELLAIEDTNKAKEKLDTSKTFTPTPSYKVKESSVNTDINKKIGKFPKIESKPINIDKKIGKLPKIKIENTDINKEIEKLSKIESKPIKIKQEVSAQSNIGTDISNQSKIEEPKFSEILRGIENVKVAYKSVRDETIATYRAQQQIKLSTDDTNKALSATEQNTTTVRLLTEKIIGPTKEIAQENLVVANSVSKISNELESSVSKVKSLSNEITGMSGAEFVITADSEEAKRDTAEFLDKYRSQLGSVILETQSQLQQQSADLGKVLSIEEDFFDASYEKRKEKVISTYETLLAQARTAYGQEEALLETHQALMADIEKAHALKKETFFKEQDEKRNKEFLKNFEETNKAALEFAERTADSLGNFFVDSMMGKKTDFSDVMKGLATDALKQLYKVLFADKLIEAFRNTLMQATMSQAGSGGGAGGVGGIGLLAAVTGGIGVLGGASSKDQMSKNTGVEDIQALMSTGAQQLLEQVLVFQEGIGKYFTLIFSKLGDFAKFVGDIAVSLFTTIVEVVKKLIAMMKDLLSGGFGGGGGVGNILGSITKMFGFAKGGMITEQVVGIGLSSGAGYTIGESGPEMVTPVNELNKSAPSLDNNGKNAYVANNSTNNVNVSIQALDSKSVVELMRNTPEAVTGPIVDSLQLGNRGLQFAIKGAIT